MINVLLNIVGCIGLVALALAGIGACVILVGGIINIVKSVKEDFKKSLKQRFTNVNIAAQNLTMSMRRIVMSGCVDIRM